MNLRGKVIGSGSSNRRGLRVGGLSPALSDAKPMLTTRLHTPLCSQSNLCGHRLEKPEVSQESSKAHGLETNTHRPTGSIIHGSGDGVVGRCQKIRGRAYAQKESKAAPEAGVPPQLRLITAIWNRRPMLLNHPTF